MSPGCNHCYAAEMAWRIVNMESKASERYAGTVTGSPSRHHRWTGDVELLDDVLCDYEDQARRVAAGHVLHRKSNRKPRCIFWCSMGDLFHSSVPAAFIRRAYRVFALLSDDLHIVCTKRPGRIAGVLYGEEDGAAYEACYSQGEALRNVWHLTTAENQEQAQRRVPELLQLRKHGPWPVLGVSCEPLLEMVDLTSVFLPSRNKLDALAGDVFQYLGPSESGQAMHGDVIGGSTGLDWVIVGGETGRQAREMQAPWLMRIVEECRRAGVPVFLKQLGDAWHGDALEPGQHRAWPRPQ